MPESVHEKLKRVRKPRVHITYEVETEGAVVLKELVDDDKARAEVCRLAGIQENQP
jgi:predicted component of type VI protein secretion system